MIAPFGFLTAAVVKAAPSGLHSIGHSRFAGAIWLVVYNQRSSGENVSAIGRRPTGIFPTIADAAKPLDRAFLRLMTVMVAACSSLTKRNPSSAVTLT